VIVVSSPFVMVVTSLDFVSLELGEHVINLLVEDSCDITRGNLERNDRILEFAMRELTQEFIRLWIASGEPLIHFFSKHRKARNKAPSKLFSTAYAAC